jgi:hypothetical protein
VRVAFRKNGGQRRMKCQQQSARTTLLALVEPRRGCDSRRSTHPKKSCVVWAPGSYVCDLSAVGRDCDRRKISQREAFRRGGLTVGAAKANAKRLTGRSPGLGREYDAMSPAPTAPRTSPAATQANAIRGRRRKRVSVPAGMVSDTTEPERASSMTIRASPMSSKRCFASFCRHRRRSSYMRGGTEAGSEDQSGSARITEARMSDVVSPVKAPR